MAADKPDLLLIGPPKPLIADGLAGAFTVHKLAQAADPAALVTEIGPRIRAFAVSMVTERVPADLMAQCPKLEIVSTFGVGYSHIDTDFALAHRIMVTNTPDVLTEEVADTALGLLLCTVRELPRADRFVRAGDWPRGEFPLTATLRDRTVGMLGMGAIGRAIARRLDAFRVPVVYHTRRQAPDLPYQHYSRLVDMARDVDTLIAIVPGGAGTRHLINADVLAALGPRGILVNMARGSVVDESALVTALQDGTILAAGLDVFENEPQVPPELLVMDNVVLLPHLGSATVATRNKMDQLVVDNLLAWAAGQPPLTPVPEAFLPAHGVA
ncbi:MAG TPA: 2-hydroxyacid dehydrogenase [Xanthobacteraceae bacterium]|nr:2-hydroxyacid dehydrogenase [Xanthobacteraceae bacterium]